MKKIDSNTRLALFILVLMILAAWLYSHSHRSTISGNAANCNNNGSIIITDKKAQRAPWCNDGEPSLVVPHTRSSGIRYN